MALYFCNEYIRQVWVAIMYAQPNCSQLGQTLGDWKKVGWWNLQSTQCANVFDEDLSEINRFYYFYAEADDNVVWAGSTYVSVPPEAFDWCIGLGSSNSRLVGFQIFDIKDNGDFTVNLLPPP